MLINSVRIVYFSPTGTTKKILEGIIDGITPKKREFTNLIKVNKGVDLKRSRPDLVVIGMPTYISRIPPEGAKILKKLQGNGIPVVLVAVYGNNKLGDVLLEMKDITTASGFIPVAAAAFIGEHSFSTEEKPIAAGRPDAQDMNEAKSFGKSIIKKMSDYNTTLRQSNRTEKQDNALNIPGNSPYRKWYKLPAQPPTTDKKLCIKCYNCQTVCPMNAIKVNEKALTDPDLCIFCCACIKGCPASARKITDHKLIEISEKLFNNCSERKAPEIFL